MYAASNVVHVGGYNDPSSFFSWKGYYKKHFSDNVALSSLFAWS